MSGETVLETHLQFPLFKRGKVRDLYDLGDTLLIVSTDRISVFDVKLPGGIPNKGESLNRLSAYWFEKTKKIFPNHFLECVDSRTMRVLKVERIDIEWVARSHLCGSAWRAYEQGRRIISDVKLPSGLRLAEELPETVLTPTTKTEVGHDMEITRSQAIRMKLVSIKEWNRLKEATFKLFEFYRREAGSKGVIIPDFKLEYGRLKGDLIQIDEPPTHDSARFWAKKYYRVGRQQEGHALDKEFLREYLRRTGFVGEGKPPKLPPLVIEEISKRCVGAYKVLTGKGRIEDLNLKNIDQLIAELSKKAC
jgi:phosphoribosylaminoimidazole-succinocarboxamide synthase